MHASFDEAISRYGINYWFKLWPHSAFDNVAAVLLASVPDQKAAKVSPGELNSNLAYLYSNIKLKYIYVFFDCTCLFFCRAAVMKPNNAKTNYNSFLRKISMRTK